MLKLSSAIVTTLVAAMTALPVAAQQADQAAPPGVVATTNNPNLSVASVRLENGVRTSKLIGSAVYSEQNERIGSVDDLVMTGDDKITVAIVSVGGFLGMGSKLVAMPFGQLKRDGDHVVLQGATKDSLNAMPNFVY